MKIKPKNKDGNNQKNIVSLLIGFLLLGLLFNPIKEIPDVPHQSFLFTCTFLATVIGIAAFYPTKQFIHRPTIIDLLVILIAVGNIYFILLPLTFSVSPFCSDHTILEHTSDRED